MIAENKSILLVGIIALILIAGVGAWMVWGGDNGGDSPEPIRQEYWMDLADEGDGYYTIGVGFYPRADGAVYVNLGDDRLLDNLGNPIWERFTEDDGWVSIQYRLAYPEGHGFDYVEDNIIVFFSPGLEGVWVPST